MKLGRVAAHPSVRSAFATCLVLAALPACGWPAAGDYDDSPGRARTDRSPVGGFGGEPEIAGIGGTGGIGGTDTANTTNTAGTAGTGGMGGISGTDAGSSAGIGGIDSAPMAGASTAGTGQDHREACGPCIERACATVFDACQHVVGCPEYAYCVIDSDCAIDDESCLAAACDHGFEDAELSEAASALDAVFACAGSYCAECFEQRDASAPELCSDSCEHASNGVCDDGGEQAARNLCPLGTDCSDCGAR